MGESVEEKHFTFFFFPNTCTVGVKRIMFISPVLEADKARAVTKPSSMKYVLCGIISLHIDNQEDNVPAGV
jgi:hypothetical protein